MTKISGVSVSKIAIWEVDGDTLAGGHVTISLEETLPGVAGTTIDVAVGLSIDPDMTAAALGRALVERALADIRASAAIDPAEFDPSKYP